MGTNFGISPIKLFDFDQIKVYFVEYKIIVV